MQVAQPMQIAFPCGVKIEMPAGWLGETLSRPDVKGPLCAAAGKDPQGPIIDVIISLLPKFLPITLPLIVGSFKAPTPVNDGPVAP